MGARGQSPTPTAILKLRGSWRAKERERDGEVQPPVGHPLAPPFATEADRAVWEHVLGEIERTPGLLTIVDGFQLERYCRTLARWRLAEKALAKVETNEDTVIAMLMDDTKRQIIRSLWAEVRACDQQLKQTEDKFGLTPSSRSRIRLFGNMADAVKGDKEQGKSRFFRA